MSTLDCTDIEVLFSSTSANLMGGSRTGDKFCEEVFESKQRAHVAAKISAESIVGSRSRDEF
jgi:hypothetical protein